MNTNDNKIKVVAYCRVSTNTENQEGSYESQKAFFEREYKDHPKYELVGIYADKGITGTSLFKRPHFNKMLYDAGIDVEYTSETKKEVHTASQRPPLFEEIHVRNTSRFARNMLSVGIIRALYDKRVYINFLDININTRDDTNNLLLPFMMAIAENESISKSKNVKFGIKESIRKGNLGPVSNIYGYENKGNYLKAKSEEAEIVRKIFELYVNEGMGVRRIVNYLRDNNISKFGKVKDLETGGYRYEDRAFTNPIISKILKNEKYAGILYRGKFRRKELFSSEREKSETHEKISESDWERIDNTDNRLIEPIISEELYYKAMERRKSSIHSQIRVGKFNGTREYTGILYCGKCGSKYYSLGDTIGAYMCSHKKIDGLKCENPCSNPNVSVELIKKRIEQYCKSDFGKLLKDIQWNEDALLNTCKIFLEEKLENEVDTDSIKICKEKLDKINSNIDVTLNNLFDDGLIKKEKYEEKLKEFNKLKEDIEKELKELTKTQEDIQNEITLIDELVDKLWEYEPKDEYTFEEVSNKINKILVYCDEDDDKTPKLTFIFNVLDDVKKITEKYRNELDTIVKQYGNTELDDLPDDVKVI